jgi:tetratricopeptide (TPR) repeat protein
MLSDEDKIGIEKYIDNDLPEEDRKAFSGKLKDNDVVSEMALQRAIATSVEDIHKNNLKAELKNLLTDKDYTHEAEPVSKTHMLIWYAAASVVAIIVIALIFIARNKSNPESLFASYYEVYPAGSSTRGSNDFNEEALKLYQEEQYQTASGLLEKMIQGNSEKLDKAYVQLLLGNCYLNLGKPNEAADCFSKASLSNDPLIAQSGQWYFALALVRNNKINDASVNLHQIIDSNSVYSKQAENLLQDIK